MKTIAFFNNKGGVGKTTLVYHLAWMLSELGLRVVALDLDPQANLTSMFLDEDRLETLWPQGAHPQTILGSMEPIMKGTGDIQPPHIESVGSRIGVVIGDLGLSRFEARLSAAWPLCMDRDEASYRVVSSFHRAAKFAAINHNAEVVIIDVGPNLGAINRSALIAADFVAVPLAPDLFSLQGLMNLGPTLRDWRREWADRLDRAPESLDISLPQANMHPAGYIVMQHAVRMDRPVKAYERWIQRIPSTFTECVLGSTQFECRDVDDDPSCLSTLKHYRSLMPMAQDARKPIFKLTSADGALGSHSYAVQDSYRDFRSLAIRLCDVCGIEH